MIGKMMITGTSVNDAVRLESEVEELEGKCSDLEEKLEVAREKLEEILNAINE